MTPESQRIAIAEACGYPKPFYKSKDIRVGGKMAGTAIWNLPDYLNDLNAMHEAEKVLTHQQLHEMNEILYDIVPVNERMWRATAAQRSEAFLKAARLWK